MDCQQVDKFMLNYCEKTLPFSLINELEEHLKHCRDCQTHYQLTCLENDVLRTNNVIPSLDDDFTGNIMAGIRSRAGEIDPSRADNGSESEIKVFGRRLTGLRSGIIAVGLVILLFIVTPYLLKTHQPVQIADKGNSTQSIDPTPKYGAVATDSPTPLARSVQKAATPNIASPVVNNPAVQQPSTTMADPVTITQDSVNTNQSLQVADEPAQIVQDKYSPLNTRALDQSSVFVERGGRSPYPVNIPDQYKLIRFENPDSQTQSYYYRWQEKNEEIELTFFPVTLQDGAATGGANLPDVNSSATNNTAKSADKGNSTTWYSDYNGRSYKLTLTGNATPDELTQLAAKIQLK